MKQTAYQQAVLPSRCTRYLWMQQLLRALLLLLVWQEEHSYAWNVNTMLIQLN